MYNTSPTKNRKRPFFNVHMKFMIYLDYSIWKFPIFSLGEGGKRRGKLSHWLYKLKFLPFFPIRLRGRGGRASDFWSQGLWFDPWWEQIFFSLLFNTQYFSISNSLLSVLLLARKVRNSNTMLQKYSTKVSIILMENMFSLS